MSKIKIIKLSEILKYEVFDADFFIKKEKVISKYKDFFKKKDIKKFLDVVQIKRPKIIKKEDLVFQNRGFNFLLKIAEEEKENKAMFFVFEIKNEQYTKEFILWFFSQKEIQDYLSLFAKGSAINFLPSSFFAKLDIIYPQNITQNLNSIDISVNSEFKDVIRIYFKEYQISLKQGNFLSASFLVGSISEAILYQFLLDNKVKKKFLERKMFGELLEIIGIMNLKIMNLEDFKKVNKFRNLIHPKNALKNINKIYNLETEIEPIFNRIIKNFGI